MISTEIYIGDPCSTYCIIGLECITDLPVLCRTEYFDKYEINNIAKLNFVL